MGSIAENVLIINKVQTMFAIVNWLRIPVICITAQGINGGWNLSMETEKEQMYRCKNCGRMYIDRNKCPECGSKERDPVSIIGPDEQ